MSKLVKFISLLLIIQLSANAKILDYKTTRLKSTGGAGVASLLMDEATVLNPAPIAFFNMSSVYVEKSSTDNKDLEENNLKGSSNLAVIASDSSKALKGSLSYVKTKKGDENYKQLSTSFASTVGPKSSLGFTYQDIKRVDNYLGNIEKNEYSQVNIGVFHAVTSSLSLGMVAMDPFKSSENGTKAILGMQYQYGKFISLMLDAGADYTTELSERSLVRGAIQFNVLSDFYIRAGMFDDKIDMQSGSGFGISWIQPKLTLNFAMSNISVDEDALLKQIAEEIQETSFSLSYRF
ncbi:hypothetical protein DAY19_04425 [Halobacteriovorax vibrionivorans]|uniref:Type IX secretion system membrane protein PorP/SprF n=1 Tax=Halobacteriovorax vibrionivorans TaxID=2152716 RepID=A0ABY0IK60_9BACT|nr:MULTISPECIES: hypothetical protein [Halobacteriovorax]RZF23022.1 hypothetical protein DAY19_04425 [Halobacteriovorax vibrionivorans]TGD48806.1 hypothetical protein EP118_02305 [Halobacteriovorax sp. Y22]